MYSRLHAVSKIALPKSKPRFRSADNSRSFKNGLRSRNVYENKVRIDTFAEEFGDSLSENAEIFTFLHEKRGLHGFLVKRRGTFHSCPGRFSGGFGILAPGTLRRPTTTQTILGKRRAGHRGRAATVRPPRHLAVPLNPGTHLPRAGRRLRIGAGLTSSAQDEGITGDVYENKGTVK